MWVVCNWQVSASSERSLVLRACVSEPPIHVVSPQPADFYAAALPHCFILHAVNLFKSMIFVIVKNSGFESAGKKRTFYLQLQPVADIYSDYTQREREEMHRQLFELKLQIGQQACPSNVENKLIIEPWCHLEVSGWDTIHYKWHIHQQEAARIRPFCFQLESSSSHITCN